MDTHLKFTNKCRYNDPLIFLVWIFQVLLSATNLLVRWQNSNIVNIVVRVSLTKHTNWTLLCDTTMKDVLLFVIGATMLSNSLGLQTVSHDKEYTLMKKDHFYKDKYSKYFKTFVLCFHTLLKIYIKNIKFVITI